MPNRILGADSFEQIDPEVKLLCRPLSPIKFLLRFHNMNEDDTKSVSTDVFSSSKLGQGSVVEMSLSVNQPKADMISKRYNWNGLELNNPSFAKTDYLDSGKKIILNHTIIVNYYRSIYIKTFGN